MAKDFAFNTMPAYKHRGKESGKAPFVVKHHDNPEDTNKRDSDDRWSKPKGRKIGEYGSRRDALEAISKHMGTTPVPANSEYGDFYHHPDEDHPHHGGRFYSIND